MPFLVHALLCLLSYRTPLYGETILVCTEHCVTPSSLLHLTIFRPAFPSHAVSPPPPSAAFLLPALSPQPDAQQQFLRIKAAYQTLTDPSSQPNRQARDQQRQQRASGRAGGWDPFTSSSAYSDSGSSAWGGGQAWGPGAAKGRPEDFYSFGEGQWMKGHDRIRCDGGLRERRMRTQGLGRGMGRGRRLQAAHSFPASLTASYS